MRPLRILLVALLVSFLVACGGDDTETTEPLPKGDVTITAKNLSFSPKTVRFDAPGTYTIVFENRDKGIVHDLHVTDAPGSPKTALKAGRSVATVRVTFPKAGTYHFRCDPHSSMKGTIVVG